VIRRPLKRRCRTFFLGPDEWLSVLVIRLDVGIDVLLELLEACEGGAAKRLPLQDREPYLDLVEPGRAGRREMKLHIGMGLEPVLVLLVGAEVIEDDVELTVWKSRSDAVHEVEKLDAAAAFRMRCDDLPGGDFERRKQRCRSMPLVIMALAGQSAAVGQLQIALRSLQSLN